MFVFPFFSAATWTLVALFSSLCYLYSIWPYRFFKRLGIPGPRPRPFIGTLHYFKKGIYRFHRESQAQYGDMWGLYDARSPVLMVADPKIIETVMVKECYSSFTNRRDHPAAGPLADAITLVKDDTWKRIRRTLTPCFTSERLEQLFPSVAPYADRLLKKLEGVAEDEAVDVKQFVAPFSLDVVTSASFGIEANALNDPHDPMNVHLEKIVNFKVWPFLLLKIFPFIGFLFKLLKLDVLPMKSLDYFYDTIQRLKDQRSTDDSSGVDFLQVMIQSQIPETEIKREQDQPSEGLTEHEILSQAFIFIYGGYETTSVTLTNTLYNLATNPAVMNKLQREIDGSLPADSPVPYEALLRLQYLDQVICESLRLMPPLPHLERVCKKNLQINGVTIPRGTPVVVPVNVLHHDPRFWTKPGLFRPERFDKDSDEEVNPYAYMPFGLGPRNCIGLSYAVLVVKMVLVRLLQRYNVEPCSETMIPLEFNWKAQPLRPIKLRFVPRRR
ncbi:cytochrome P450 3A27-like [Cynoglossus semilaevis]|uniref:unspecific monooxygenase n=1 Tax=Cynoglossus semilaevis TaxID=244447 RepID=A0A3P8ULM3_CYNSE|nr:cytochrome P450 3A27-like [Cynoglossus semilaevis]